jgi:sec-independent protein translocase protein TatA
MVGLESPLHIAIVLIVVLLVFGAKRLPEMGKSLGSGMRGFKDALSGQEPSSELHSDPLAELHSEPVAELHSEPVAELHAEPVAELHSEPVSRRVEEPVH